MCKSELEIRITVRIMESNIRRTRLTFKISNHRSLLYETLYSQLLHVWLQAISGPLPASAVPFFPFGEGTTGNVFALLSLSKRRPCCKHHCRRCQPILAAQHKATSSPPPFPFLRPAPLAPQPPHVPRSSTITRPAALQLETR